MAEFIQDLVVNTDPLALTALGGLVTVLVVTIALFIFIMTRGGKKSSPNKG